MVLKLIFLFHFFWICNVSQYQRKRKYLTKMVNRNLSLIIMLTAFLCLLTLNLSEYFNLFYVESIGVPISAQKIKQIKYSLCMDKIEHSQNTCYSKNNGSFDLNRGKDTKIYVNKFHPEICKYESNESELIYISFLFLASIAIIFKINQKEK